MNRLQAVRNGVRTGARVAAIVAGYAFAVLSIVICVEIIARKFFSFSLEAVDEFGGYTVAIATSLAFSFALSEGAHTRIDMLLPAFSPRARARLNWLAAVLMSFFACFIAHRAWSAFVQSIQYGSVSTSVWQIPLWLPQSLWVLALAIFAAISLFIAIHASVLLAIDITSLNRLYGPSAIDEELEQELKAVATRMRGSASGEPR